MFTQAKQTNRKYLKNKQQKQKKNNWNQNLISLKTSLRGKENEPYSGFSLSFFLEYDETVLRFIEAYS